MQNISDGDSPDIKTKKEITGVIKILYGLVIVVVVCAVHLKS